MQLSLAAAPSIAADREANVLILNGTDPYLPAYLDIDSAMRASLANQSGERIVLFGSMESYERRGRPVAEQVQAAIAGEPIDPRRPAHCTESLYCRRGGTSTLVVGRESVTSRLRDSV